MTLWLPSSNKFYIPTTPVSRILSTEEYVTRTSQIYYAGTDRLLTVGHPQFEITGRDGALLVPKVSPLQYRVFRFRFPDPNQFVFSEPGFFNPEKQRLVWAVLGLEVSKGQPLGVGVSGHIYTNRFEDVENPNKLNVEPAKAADNRVNLGFDAKQQQVLILGCKPAGGEHWGPAIPCRDIEHDQNKCPPLELKNSYIEDGDMMDAGLGNLDFASLQASKSDAPLEICQSICKSPDMIRMAQDLYGDMCFFCIRNEQLFLRHFFTRAGAVKEEIPAHLLFKANTEPNKPTNNYWGAPSGSLVSSNNQIFNKPYWVRKTQGLNNGILWHNQLFLTVGDTTRGTIFNISVKNNGNDQYQASNFNEYIRHVQDFQMSFILQACIVDLTPDTVAHLHQMDKTILEQWNLGLSNTANSSVDETYRFITSEATKCPTKVVKEKPKDPFEGLRFWDIDLSERLSQDLSHFPLGRKFLYSTRVTTTSVSRKRKGNSVSVSSVKRRRVTRK